MRAEQEGRHVIRYEKEKSDRVWEAMERLARIRAAELDDGTASTVADLFAEWSVGTYYARGTRIANGKGNLYRVEQDHTSQADWLISGTPSLYTPLGVTEEDPAAICLWRQPLGAHDAYPKGARRWGLRAWSMSPWWTECVAPRYPGDVAGRLRAALHCVPARHGVY